MFFNFFHLGAETQRDAPVAQLVGEIGDQFLVEEIEHGVARLDKGDMDIEGGKDRGVFDADDAGADDRDGARQFVQLQDLVAIEDVFAVEGNIVRPERLGADGNDEPVGRKGQHLARLSLDLDLVRIDEAGLAGDRVDLVAGELVFEHLDLVVEGNVKARAQVGGGQVFLDPIGAAVEAALAPAGQVQHGLAQGLRRYRAGVDRNPADAAAAFDHEHPAPELRRLDCRPSSCRSAADHDQFVMFHEEKPRVRV
jgi:hypothetical protein